MAGLTREGARGQNWTTGLLITQEYATYKHKTEKMMGKYYTLMIIIIIIIIIIILNMVFLLYSFFPDERRAELIRASMFSFE